MNDIEVCIEAYRCATRPGEEEAVARSNDSQGQSMQLISDQIDH